MEQIHKVSFRIYLDRVDKVAGEIRVFKYIIFAGLRFAERPIEGAGVKIDHRATHFHTYRKLVRIEKSSAVIGDYRSRLSRFY